MNFRWNLHTSSYFAIVPAEMIAYYDILIHPAQLNPVRCPPNARCPPDFDFLIKSFSCLRCSSNCLRNSLSSFFNFLCLLFGVNSSPGVIPNISSSSSSDSDSDSDSDTDDHSPSSPVSSSSSPSSSPRSSPDHLVRLATPLPEL